MRLVTILDHRLVVTVTPSLGHSFYPPLLGEGGFESRQDSVRRPASRFLVGAKTQKQLVNFFGNFNIIFLATWGCASDFLELLPKL